MPRMDGTGPMGMGAMSGGGFGKCNGAATSVKGCARRQGRGVWRNAELYGYRADVPEQANDTAVSEAAGENALAAKLKLVSEENERLTRENEKLRGGKAGGSKSKQKSSEN